MAEEGAKARLEHFRDDRRRGCDITALAAVVGMLNQLGFVENHLSSPTGAKASASLSADAPSET